MARLYVLPKGHKSVKYSNKKPPKRKAIIYKRIIIFLIFIILAENGYLFRDDILQIGNVLWEMIKIYISF